MKAHFRGLWKRWAFKWSGNFTLDSLVSKAVGKGSEVLVTALTHSLKVEIEARLFVLKLWVGHIMGRVWLRKYAYV